MGSATLVASGTLRYLWLAVRLFHLLRLCDIPLMSDNWTRAFLQLFSTLGLFHQDWEPSLSQRCYHFLQLMFESSLKLQTPPLLGDVLQVVPRQMLELVYILMHCHVPLMQCKEFILPVLSSCIWKVFLQESSPEVGPSHRLFPSPHLLFHACPSIFSILIQQIGSKQQLLLIFVVHHLEDLLTFAEPRIRFIGRGFASKLRWLVAQEVLHSWHPNWCNRRSRLRCYRCLHRIHHPVNSSTMSSTPLPFLLLLATIAWIRHITIHLVKQSHSSLTNMQLNHINNQTVSSLPKSPKIFLKYFQNFCSDTNCNIPKEYYKFLINK